MIMRKNLLESIMSGRQVRMNVKNLALLPSLLLVGILATRTGAVEQFTVSGFGEGSQIWWEAEDFDQRIPDTDDHFALASAPDDEEAFGADELNTINRIGAGGRISYTFDINQLGEAGTWYFWGRVLNPNNLSDYMLVDGHPGDIVPTEEPFSGAFTDSQRVFERNTGPPFGWSGGAEGHIKQLQDGENTMHIVHRQAEPEVFWDVMMWTDDPLYVPTDEDYMESEPFVPIDLPGDFDGDGFVNDADYAIMLDNFNTDVDRGMDGDITFNGHVDYRDFVKLRSTIEAQPAGAATVPEPEAFWLFGAAVLVFGGFRRRRFKAVHPKRDAVFGKGHCLLGVIAIAFAIHATNADSFAQEVIIVQSEGANYLAFEAEDYFDLNNGDDTTGWNTVGITDPFITPAGNLPGGTPVLAEDTTAARREAMFDFPGGGTSDFIRYRLQFVEDADYSLYLRYSLFDIQSGTSVYGNEDSIYVSSDFGVDGILVDDEFADPRGGRDERPSFYGVLPKGAGVQQGNFGWWNADADGSDPTAENPDAVYAPEVNETLDFGIAARERGVAIDRIVFHENPSLSDAELDALLSFDPFTIGLTPNDFNKDESVDLDDVDVMRENFGVGFSVSDSFEKGDGNRDGFVDLRDFLQIRQVINPAVAAASSSVPEPSGETIAILVVAVGVTFLRRRRKKSQN